MYKIYLFSEQDSMAFLSVNISYPYKGKLTILLLNKKLQQESLPDFNRVEIFVKNNLEVTSKIISANINKVSIKNCYIYIDFIEDMDTDCVFRNNIFENINMILMHKYRLWLSGDEDKKFHWLRSCYFYNRHHKSYNKNITIDGRFIKTKNDFLCEFSEQIIGVGGYFGSDLDGFADCFDIYDINDIQVIWCDFYKNSFPEKNIILEILRTYNLNVVI